ncbi:MAG: PA14 domain-containing protein [Anaerolineales bacterium]
MNTRVTFRFGLAATLLLWVALIQFASAEDLFSIYLPFIANSTHHATPTRTATASPTLIATALPSPTQTATSTPSATYSATASATSTPTTTVTPSPSSTDTSSPTSTVTPFPCAGNGATYEQWDGIGGSSVADLRADARYPDEPTSRGTRTNFNTGQDIGDNYGGVLRAILCVPTTGNYRFWVNSDDNSELLLYTTPFTITNPNVNGITDAMMTIIASEPSYRNYLDFSNAAPRRSDPISLTAGMYYYLKVVYKEAVAADHAVVAWKRPGDPNFDTQTDYDTTYIISQLNLLSIAGTPTATSTVTGTATITPSLTPSPNCVTGAPDVSVDPNALQILFTNPAIAMLNRRLTGLSVSWSGAQLITSISLGSVANVIWAGGPVSSTLILGETDWTGSNRSIVTDTFRPLSINFDRAVYPGSYIVSATWDDGFGGNLCTSPPVNLP